MKSGTRDEVEGKLHQVKGKIKEIAGHASMNPDLEAEGKGEKSDGQVQEKLGLIKKLFDK
ncbi:MAG: CsbD family protein [Desulfatitalea sp.]